MGLVRFLVPEQPISRILFFAVSSDWISDHSIILKATSGLDMQVQWDTIVTILVSLV